MRRRSAHQNRAQDLPATSRWAHLCRRRHPRTTSLTITADRGGSNSNRTGFLGACDDRLGDAIPTLADTTTAGPSTADA